MVARHAERVGELVTVEFGDQAQLDDVPLARVQAGDRGLDQFLQLGPFGRDTDIGALGVQVRGVLEGGQGVPGAEPAQALVARDRVEPGAQLARVAKAMELSRGDEKRILHRVGGIGRLSEHRTAV